MSEQENKEKRASANEIGEIIKEMPDDEIKSLLNIIIGFKLGIEAAKKTDGKSA